LNKNRHISAKFGANRSKFDAFETKIPQFVERDQHGGGVRAAAADAALHRKALADFDRNSGAVGACPHGESPRCPDGEVRLGRHARQLTDALDHAAGPPPEPDVVAEIDELERRLEQVIAIGAPAHDVEEQVELARCWPRLGPAERTALRAQGCRPDATVTCQSSTTTLSRTAPWVAVKRSGRETPPDAVNMS